MNIDELDAAIRAGGATNQYDLRTVATPESQPSDMTVLEPAADDSGQWVVYYSERGQINDPRYFDTEDEACDFVPRPAPCAPAGAPRADAGREGTLGAARAAGRAGPAQDAARCRLRPGHRAAHPLIGPEDLIPRQPTP